MGRPYHELQRDFPPSEQVSSSSVRRSLILFSSCLACIALALNAANNVSYFPSIRRLRINLSPVLYVNVTEKRPAVHAFYAQGYDDLSLRVWADLWSEAGFAPVILTYEDVLRHPDSKSLYSFLAAQSVSERNRYLGFIAMATIPGGGWLSELDVLPLNLEAEYSLPNQGKLTSHGAQTSSLISASYEEWKKVVTSMISVSDESTDSNNTMSFNQTSIEHNHNSSILSAKEIFSSSFFYEDWCDTVKDKLAVQYFRSGTSTKSLEDELYIGSVEKWVQLHRAKCKSGRPVMFTFYEPITDEIEPAENMLEVWKEAWSSDGWEPFVLGNADARRHPSFQEVKVQFQAAEFELSQSNYACYLRWFAMAASGGGWMSDYDVLPLNMPPSSQLPNDGEFTGYERHVPCLLSGSAREWERMSNLIMNSYRNHRSEFWSDMFALKEIHDTTDSFLYRDDAAYLRMLYPEVMNEGKKLVDPYAMDEKCEMMRSVKAVHFSYFDMEQIGFSKDELRRRDGVLVYWIKAWKEQCRDKLAPSEEVVVPPSEEVVVPRILVRCQSNEKCSISIN